MSLGSQCFTLCHTACDQFIHDPRELSKQNNQNLFLSALCCWQWLGLTRRVSVKKTFLNNVVKQVERHGSAHAKVTLDAFSKLTMIYILSVPLPGSGCLLLVMLCALLFNALQPLLLLRQSIACLPHDHIPVPHLVEDNKSWGDIMTGEL